MDGWTCTLHVSGLQISSTHFHASQYWVQGQALVHQISTIFRYFDSIFSILHRSVPIMLNYAHFRASFWVILQNFASKISKNSEKSVYLRHCELAQPESLTTPPPKRAKIHSRLYHFLATLISIHSSYMLSPKILVIGSHGILFVYFLNR